MASSFLQSVETGKHSSCPPMEAIVGEEVGVLDWSLLI